MATYGDNIGYVSDREVDRSDSVLLAFHRDELLFFIRVQSFYRFFSTIAKGLGEHTSVAC